MARFRALFDTNSLISPDLRAILLAIGAEGVYTPSMTERTIRSAFARNAQYAVERHGRDPAVMAAWADTQSDGLIDAYLPFLISGYEKLEEELAFEPAGDRYLVAAALVGGVDVIVTRDRALLDAEFPTEDLCAQTPDEFLTEQFSHAPATVIECLQAVIRDRPYESIEALLERVREADLAPTFAADVTAYLESRRL